jgi:hypothetical protein
MPAGHNLESTWLVADTLNYLQSISAISPQLARQYRATVMSIGAAAARAGFDRVHGGIYEYGSPATGPESTVKVWWIQAESMLALWKLHQYYSSPSGTGVSPAVGSLARQGSIEDVRLGAPTAKNSNANVNANVNANANANVNANVNANANANANVSQVVGDRARLQYLYMLAKTARFVSEKLTDTEGGGEQFWQVRLWSANFQTCRLRLFITVLCLCELVHGLRLTGGCCTWGPTAHTTNHDAATLNSASALGLLLTRITGGTVS